MTTTPEAPGPARAESPTLPEIAVKRGTQTLLQSLGIDVAVAACLGISTVVGPWEGWDDAKWQLLGFTVGKSVVLAAVSWVIRRYADRSGVRSPHRSR